VFDHVFDFGSQVRRSGSRDGIDQRTPDVGGCMLAGTTVYGDAGFRGQYIKAAAVLKQDLEILTRIREVRANVAVPKKVPNMKHAPEGAGRFYGDLNSIAHPSTLQYLQENLAQLHSADVHGVSPVPSFASDMACRMYELHIWLTLEVAREQVLLFAEMYGENDPHLETVSKWFARAVSMLEKAGFQAVAPGAEGNPESPSKSLDRR
jgi:hypothetical protein